MESTAPLPRHPNRRQILGGLAAASLGACSGAGPGEEARTAIPESDPLAAYRVFSDAAPGTWAPHLPPLSGARGPRVLALSGGGEDGAFGAGALAGWTAAGDRPAFDLVTGVSTGALIAPFAFLGPERDSDLRHIFTEHDAGDIMRLQPMKLVFSDALYDTSRLAELIESFTPPEMLAEIAARHERGARLLVVTSDLDRARASIWDMGALAKAGRYSLFRAILRASAALPGLFPPVTLTYAEAGTRYAETHIDGGVAMQFLAVPEFAFTSGHGLAPDSALYLLINNTLTPAPVAVPRSALAISQQALTTATRASALAEVNATRLAAERNVVTLSVAAVDAQAGMLWDPSDRFSAEYMQRLYAHGYARGRAGTLWQV